MIFWPNELINDIASRRCVLFLGSGVSANSTSIAGKKPATWENFLRDICAKRIVSTETKKLIDDLLARYDYLTACEIIVETIGEHIFGEELAEEYRRPGYHPHKIHEVIFSLDSRIVITPNIDNIYDRYVNTKSNGTIVMKTYYDEDIAKYLRSQDYITIKAHGTVDASDRVIFTHRQYSNARYAFSSFYKILDALMLTHTYIFIGCGISDPDIQLILENYNFTFPRCRPHFFITSDDTFANKISGSLKQNRNIELITYDNSKGDHSELLVELEELSKEVEAKRVEIAGRMSW